jgi:hypothetical protein
MTTLLIKFNFLHPVTHFVDLPVLIYVALREYDSLGAETCSSDFNTAVLIMNIRIGRVFMRNYAIYK